MQFQYYNVVRGAQVTRDLTAVRGAQMHLLPSLLLTPSPLQLPLHDTMIPRTSTRFILINTINKENIGSAARAIKTMGFDALSLVHQRDDTVQHALKCKKIKNRASGALDVLQNIKNYTCVTDAVKGCNLICGTGMPVDMHRKRREREYIEPRVYFERLLNDIVRCDNNVYKYDSSNDVDVQQKQLDIAFLFGCETTGMDEEDMDKCHVVLGIPTNPKFGSLNLASAVQIIAYDWRMALGWDAA